MTAYAENLVAASELRKKRGLTPAQAARPRRYQRPPSSNEKNLSKQVGAACNDFFNRRGMAT
jgi:hypothetical protein